METGKERYNIENKIILISTTYKQSQLSLGYLNISNFLVEEDSIMHLLEKLDFKGNNFR